jgi:hypothetical protein
MGRPLYRQLGFSSFLLRRATLFLTIPARRLFTRGAIRYARDISKKLHSFTFILLHHDHFRSLTICCFRGCFSHWGQLPVSHFLEIFDLSRMVVKFWEFHGEKKRTYKSKRIPSIFNDESAESFICLTFHSILFSVFSIPLLFNGIDACIGRTCNTTRVQHDTIIP